MVLAKLKPRSLLSNRHADCTKFAYDNNGNQTLELVPTLTRTTNVWDGEDRLTQVKRSTTDRSTYTYKGENNLRVIAEEPSAATSKFIWDGSLHLVELDSSNSTVAIYSSDTTQFGIVVSQYRASISSLYCADSFGSVTNITNNNAVITDSYGYKSFGDNLYTSGTTINPYHFMSIYKLFIGDVRPLVAKQNTYYDQRNGRTLSKTRDDNSITNNYMPFLNNLLLNGNFSTSDLEAKCTERDTPFGRIRFMRELKDRCGNILRLYCDHKNHTPPHIVGRIVWKRAPAFPRFTEYEYLEGKWGECIYPYGANINFPIENKEGCWVAFLWINIACSTRDDIPIVTKKVLEICRGMRPPECIEAVKKWLKGQKPGYCKCYLWKCRDKDPKTNRYEIEIGK